MLYKTLKKLKERNGLTEDLKNKIDIFFATGRITEEQYNELMDVVVKEEPKVETNQLNEGFKNGEEFENIAADYPALTTDDLEAIKETLDAD